MSLYCFKLKTKPIYKKMKRSREPSKCDPVALYSNFRKKIRSNHAYDLRLTRSFDISKHILEHAER